MTTTQSYQNSDKIWYNDEHEQVQMIICTPVSQTLSVFHLGLSSCYRVSETFLPAQTVISHLQVHSHCLAVFIPPNLGSQFHPSAAILSLLMKNRAHSWHTGAATPFASDGNESTAWAHERSGLCSLSLRFYSLNFWFSFSTSAFQNETRRRMIQSWQNTDL